MVFRPGRASERLEKHFEVNSLKGFGIEHMNAWYFLRRCHIELPGDDQTRYDFSYHLYFPDRRIALCPAR